MKRIDNRQRQSVLVKRDYQKDRNRPNLFVARDKQAERERRRNRRNKA